MVPEKVKLSIGFEEFREVLLLKIKVLRNLLFLFRPGAGLTTGFRFRISASRISFPLDIESSILVFENHLYFKASKVFLHFFHLAIRNSFEHGAIDSFVKEVVFDLVWAGLALEVLQFPCRMRVLRPSLNVQKDIFSIHFFYSIKIY